MPNQRRGRYTFSSRGMTAVHPCPRKTGGLFDAADSKEGEWLGFSGCCPGRGDPSSRRWLPAEALLSHSSRGPEEHRYVSTGVPAPGHLQGRRGRDWSQGEDPALSPGFLKPGEACKGRGRRYLNQTVGPLPFLPIPSQDPSLVLQLGVEKETRFKLSLR